MCFPDLIYRSITYSVLLKLCSDSDDLERGMKIIEKMAREGVRPDSAVYSAVKYVTQIF